MYSSLTPLQTQEAPGHVKVHPTPPHLRTNLILRALAACLPPFPRPVPNESTRVDRLNTTNVKVAVYRPPQATDTPWKLPSPRLPILSRYNVTNHDGTYKARV